MTDQNLKKLQLKFKDGEDFIRLFLPTEISNAHNNGHILGIVGIKADTNLKGIEGLLADLDRYPFNAKSFINENYFMATFERKPEDDIAEEGNAICSMVMNYVRPVKTTTLVAQQKHNYDSIKDKLDKNLSSSEQNKNYHQFEDF